MRTCLTERKKRLKDELTRKALPLGEGRVLLYFGQGGNFPLNRVEILEC